MNARPSFFALFVALLLWPALLLAQTTPSALEPETGAVTATQPATAPEVGVVATTQRALPPESPAVAAKREALAQSHSVVIVQLEGEINDYTRDDLMRRFRIANDMGATAIIVEIDSWGGLVTSGLETSRFIKQQKIPVVAFVREKAISAGAMIALACDAIYMSSHSLIGDAAPIVMGGGGGAQDVGEVYRAKIESPVVEDFRDSAQRNGHNQLLAEAMVVVGREVYYVQNESGEKRFVNKRVWDELSKEGGWEPVYPDRHPLDSEKELLTLSADLAVELGLGRGLAMSSEDVAEMLNWNVVGRLERTGGDRIIAFLASMEVRSLLMVVLLISIYMAIQTPGTGLPETAALIALATLMGVPMMTGYAQWWEIVLVLLGIILIAVELFLIPGFGFTGIGGVLLVIAGLIMTFVPKEPIEIPGILPQLEGTRQAMREGFIAVMGSVIISMIAVYFLAKMLPSMPLFRRLVLTTTVGGGVAADDMAAEDPTAVAALAWVRVGDEGVALTDLRPGGTARFADRIQSIDRNLDVICDSGFIPAGSRLRVQELQGSTIVVRKA